MSAPIARTVLQDGRASGPTRPTDGHAFAGLGFVWAAIGLSLTGGFGLATGLLISQALGLPIGAWWIAAVQAHGHIQLVGWAAMMVLGVGLHLLPRLRGAPLARPAWRRPALWLLGSGLTLRMIGQPLAAALTPELQPAARWLGLGASGVLSLAGASLLVAMLAATLRAGPPLRERPALRQVLPLLAAGFSALLTALAGTAALGLAAAAAGTAVVPLVWSDLVVDLALLGFLVPVCLAVSARFFPLYLGVRPAPPAGLRLALGLLLAGLALRALSLSLWSLRPVGDLLVGGGLLVGLWSVGQHATRRIGGANDPPEWLPTGLFRPPPPPPGRPGSPPPATVTARLVLRCAYAWLVVAALLALVAGAAGVGAPPADLERHALGAGFVTLLIVGMATLLLPGFLGGPVPAGPIAVGLVLGNVAAALRLLPGLASWLAPGLLPGTAGPALHALAGLCGLATVGCVALIARSASQRIPRHAIADA